MKIANFRLYPYLLLLMMAGIISASFNILFVSLSLIFIGICLFIYFYKKKRRLALGILFFIIGVSIVTVHFAFNKKDSCDSLNINARIIKRIDNDTFVVDSIQVDEKTIYGRGIIDNYNKGLKVGEEVNFSGHIERIKLKPYDNYSSYRYTHKQYYDLKIVNLNDWINNQKFDVRIRLGIKQKISIIKDNNVRAMLYALLTGDRSMMTDYCQENMSNVSVAHIFAVSGMHIAILGGVIFFVLKKMKINRWVRFFVVTFSLLGYGYICGFTPSVNRAILVSILVMFGLEIGKRIDMISLTSFSALILLMLNPIYLFDCGFLLSYSAVFGILMLYKPLMEKMTFKSEKFNQLITSTISANAGIFPISTYYFGKFSLLFFVANLIVLPMMSFIYITSFAILILSVFPFMNYLMFVPAFFLDIIYSVVDLLNKINVHIPTRGFGIFSIFYFMILFLLSEFNLLDKKTTKKYIYILSAISVLGLILTNFTFKNI